MDTLAEHEELAEERDFLTKDDLLLAVRKLRGYTDEKMLAVQKAIRKDLADFQSSVTEMFQEGMAAIRQEIADIHSESSENSSSDVTELANEQKSLRDYMESKTHALQKAIFDKVEERLDGQNKWLDRQIHALSNSTTGIEYAKKAYDEGVVAGKGSIESVLKMLPSIVNQVNIPESAIKFYQEPAHVNVHVPQQLPPNVDISNIKLLIPTEAFKLFVEQPAPQVHLPERAIQVKMEQQPIIFNVPAESIKMAPSTVNVTMPQQKAPVINVEVPKYKTKKTLEYYDNGLPKHIIEEPLPIDEAEEDKKSE